MNKVADTNLKVKTAASLLRRVCDPACGRGESENAALKLVAVVKSNSISYESLVATLAPPQVTEVEVSDREPAACLVRMPFGRWKGCTLAEVAEEEPSYLFWIIENVRTDRAIVNAAQAVAAYYGLGRRRDK